MISAWGPCLPQEAGVPGEKEEEGAGEGQGGGAGGGGRPSSGETAGEQLGEARGKAASQEVVEPPQERAELPEEADQRHQLQRVQLQPARHRRL